MSEQEIADAKAIIGRCGIGCEPASAATLAGIRKLTAAGVIDRDADVVAVLTGNVLKDPDYIYKYHTGKLKAPDGHQSNRPTAISPSSSPTTRTKSRRCWKGSSGVSVFLIQLCSCVGQALSLGRPHRPPFQSKRRDMPPQHKALPNSRLKAAMNRSVYDPASRVSAVGNAWFIAQHVANLRPL